MYFNFFIIYSQKNIKLEYLNLTIVTLLLILSKKQNTGLTLSYCIVKTKNT